MGRPEGWSADCAPKRIGSASLSLNTSGNTTSMSRSPAGSKRAYGRRTHCICVAWGDELGHVGRRHGPTRRRKVYCASGERRKLEHRSQMTLQVYGRFTAGAARPFGDSRFPRCPILK